MIGVDTNILIRVFIDDEPAQTAAARKLVSGAEDGSLLVSIIVLVEFIWTLRSSFKVDKAALTITLEGILTRAAFVVEDRADVEAALQRYKTANIDPADVLIAARNKRLGAARTVSFDQTAIRNAVFESLSA
jgi:predicted nucleic-acid-binding protein